ncbi:MAG: hypothetical protein PF549_03430, partial [Patescibacteria group bacterium]|nr:hypothetical protein [Patescibacteria group bacterium]
MKNSLYIGGGFDVLHSDHKNFIIKGINKFEELYKLRPKLIIGLKSDNRLNKQKGEYRPFFNFDWRYEDLNKFLNKIGVEFN